jgi:hypothetical protein
MAVPLLGHAGTPMGQAVDYAGCGGCHGGIQAMNAEHDFPCARCHLRPADRDRTIDDHRRIVRYPAAPSHVEMFCGECHRREIDQLHHSLHWTLAGMINQTRFLWGAQPDPGVRYSVMAGPQSAPLPDSPQPIQSPADLVDDLLKHRCFACHIGTPAPQERGRFRGVGCAACHVPFADDGRYRGKDETLQGKPGYPLRHVFSRPISIGQCLHCHNGPRIGADYIGLFQHDFHQSYRTPLGGGTLPRQIYIMDHHLLQADVHYNKGLLCVDCHDAGDVMGKTKTVVGEKEAVGVRCRSCHVKDQSIPAHIIPGMEKVHCLGCQAAWGFMDSGPSVMRDDRKDLPRWAPWGRRGDGAVAGLFDARGRFVGKGDAALPGPWLLGWRFRRWEYLTLGKDDKGRIVSFRPRYQYQVTYVDITGRVVLDSVVPMRGDGTGKGWAYMPYYPHTVQKRGRNCEACHGKPLAAGNGLWEGFGPDLALTKPSPPVYPSMALLTEAERQKLLHKSNLYRRWRFKTLWWDFQHQEKSRKR